MGWSSNTEGNTFGLTTSLNAIQDSTDGRDLYFLVLDPAWKTPRLATYFGSTGREHVDGGTSRFDKSGRIFKQSVRVTVEIQIIQLSLQMCTPLPTIHSTAIWR